MKTGMLVLLMSGLMMHGALAAELARALSAEAIARKANHMALYQGDDCRARVTMVITDRQGRTRHREFNMLRRDDGADDQNQKFYAVFLKPADVRKMVFMVHKHAALQQDDDRWLYMPALDLVKRIAAGDKRTSFVGSDFLYEDISGRGVEEDMHELVETTDACFVIKNTPRRPADVEFAYYLAHIDRKTFLPLKLEYFKSDERLYRVIESTRVEAVAAEENGLQVLFPTVVRSVARDLESGGSTEMTTTAIRYNLGLDDSVFSERYLRRPPRTVLR